jgi:hypothetical protein
LFLLFVDHAVEIAEMCMEFRDKGVVGIDIAGDEGGLSKIPGEEPGLFIPPSSSICGWFD